ncbi:hypothetical protein SEA_GUYFAGIERI_4 [Rhodococcus phage GuyFagieri]|nr:hypothetical protein SEA_GUYFAGIERI_4 [Rhodococcus phage GuyFagieri]
MTSTETTTADLSRIEERVKAIMNQAEGPGVTEAEAEAFRDKAYALLAKYGLDEAKLRAADPEAAANKIVSVYVPMAGGYRREHQRLLGLIAGNMSCKVLDYTDNSGSFVYGVQAHIDRALMLYRVVLPQLERATAAATPPDPSESFAAFFSSVLNDTAPASASAPQRKSAATRQYRRSFAAGFAARIGIRVKEMEERARRAETEESGSDSTALVLITDAERAQAQIDTDFAGKLNRRKRKGNYDPTGARAGAAAGDRADLGGNHLGGGRKALA